MVQRGLVRDAQPVSETRHASRAGYWVGAAAAVAGVVLGALVIASSVREVARAFERLEQVAVPGQRVLTLPAGEHGVYHEATAGRPAAGAITVVVQDAAGGPPIPLRPYGGSFDYNLGDRSGQGVSVFKVPRAGRYRITTTGASGSGLGVVIGPPVTDFVGSFSSGFGGFGLILGGILIGIVLVIVTAVRRRNRSSATVAAAAAAAAGWYPDPWGQASRRWWDGGRWTGHTEQ